MSPEIEKLVSQSVAMVTILTTGCFQSQRLIFSLESCLLYKVHVTLFQGNVTIKFTFEKIVKILKIIYIIIKKEKRKNNKRKYKT